MAAKLPARRFPRETMDNERAVEVGAIVGGDRARLNEGRLHAALAQRAASLSPPEFSKSDLFQSFFVGMLISVPAGRAPLGPSCIELSRRERGGRLPRPCAALNTHCPRCLE